MTNARYLLAWFVMLLASIVNGILRDFTYGRHISELPSQQISTLTGIVMLGVLIYFYVRRWPPNSGRQALNIGLFWVSLTIVSSFCSFIMLVAVRGTTCWQTMT